MHNIPDPVDLIASGCIAVIGDVMLDCYLSGEVRRISPEAPVPVMRVMTERAVAGGAGNVAANLASLGVKVALVGLVGADRGAEIVESLHKIGDVDCSGLVVDPDRCTTRKLRIIGGHQQIVRVDHEDVVPLSEAVEAELIDRARSAIERADAVIISDYGKGVCCDAVLAAAIDQARIAGKLIVVDPKRTDFRCYQGASILTPNRNELAQATRLPVECDEEAANAALMARQQCHADILLTRSEKGMSFFPMAGEALHLATRAQDVFDVSGAGDTVIAVLTAALAVNLTMAEAMRLANHAAGIVVSKLGTVTAAPAELRNALIAEQRLTAQAGALVSLADAQRLCAGWAQQGMTVGVTNGCFDLIHPGHISLLRQAADACDRLVVAINSDASVRRLKGPSRPVQEERARAEVIGAIRGVAAVLIFEDETPYRVIEALKPDVLIKGADYRIEQVVGADIVKAWGGRVVLAELRDGHSSSALVAAASNNQGR